MGKVIDVDFGDGPRERWCRACDEPFPEGTALCPRCGGELVLAALHRAEVEAATRRSVRTLLGAVFGALALGAAFFLWMIFR